MGLCLALRPDHVEHLHTRTRQRRRGAGDRLVEPPRSLRAAGDQQGRPVGVEVEEPPRLCSGRLAVEPGDHRPQRQADVLRPGQRGAGEADRHPAREAGTGLVGQAGHGVLLVEDDRHPAPPGREVGGHRDVAAEADDHLGARAVEHAGGLTDGAAQPDGDLEQVDAEAAWQRHRRDQLERIARLGDDAALQATRRAETGDLDAGLEPAQGVGRGQQRRGVSGGAAAGQEYAHVGVEPREGRLTDLGPGHDRPTARRIGYAGAGGARPRPRARVARTRPAAPARRPTGPGPSHRRRRAATGCR